LIEEYAFREKVPVWGKIPFSRQAAEISAEAKLLIHHPGYREKFEEIIGSVLGGEL
jgi:MinD superfamily P-loop ATPase